MPHNLSASRKTRLHLPDESIAQYILKAFRTVDSCLSIRSQASQLGSSLDLVLCGESVGVEKKINSN
jgi:hypothetical protein